MSVDVRQEKGYLRAMHAVVREDHEVSMLTNEAIEVHLASLHAGQDELRQDVRELRADCKSLRDRIDEKFGTLDKKIDGVNTSLSAKIDGVNTSLSAKIDGVNTSLHARIDGVNTSLHARIDAVNTSLSEKIDRLSNEIASMRGMQKGLFWFIGVLGSFGFAGKFLHWF